MLIVTAVAELGVLIPVHDGLMQGHGLGDDVPVLGGEVGGAGLVVGIGASAFHLHADHILQGRHPGDKAEAVHLQPEKAHGHQRQQHRAATPCLPHTEGLLQQHLGHEVADGSPQQQVAGQAAGDIDAERGVQPEAQTQAGAQGHAVLEDGLHNGDGHHVTGGFHMPSAVDQQGQPREDKAHRGVDGQRGHALQPVDGVDPAPAHLFSKAHGGSQPLHYRRSPSGQTGEAVQEGLHQIVHQRKHHNGKKIQNAVKGGQGQQMAGKHGAEHRKGVEEQAHGALGGQPDADGVQIYIAAQPLCRKGQQPHHAVGAQQAHKAGHVAGQEQALPPDGQGVDHAGGAVVIEVGEHAHGGQDAEAEGHERAEALQQEGDLIGEGLYLLDGGFTHPELVSGHHHKTPNRQGVGPDQGVQSPDGPVADKVFLQQGGVKERCRGLHNPHLPVHR